MDEQEHRLAGLDDPHPDEPFWRLFPRAGGFVIAYKTNSRFSDQGVMTIGQAGGSPLYAVIDEETVYPSAADAHAAIAAMQEEPHEPDVPDPRPRPGARAPEAHLKRGRTN
jgi:hypothetical protein